MSKYTFPENYDHFKGEIEIEVRDRSGRIIRRHREHNLIKIFAKEMLAHRLGYSRIWDPNGGSGSGAWVSSGIDPAEEFAAKYILFGASFDANGAPLDTADPRFYHQDPITGTMVANSPYVGADNHGDLINPIPISEPNRPLKRIENVYFESSYQPADTPLLQDDVRAMNNVLVLETTLRQDEYNGLGTSSSDFFTITEVALAGGAALDDVGACEATPQTLFLRGAGGASDTPIAAIANGTQTISISADASVADVNRIVQGDQIMIVDSPATTQVNPYYLAMSKSNGREIVLDRCPETSDGTPLAGPINIYRSTLRLFSQRILAVPFKKSSDFEILCRWRIAFN